MIPELGNFALALATGLALLLSIYPLLGAYRQDLKMMAAARPLAYGLLAMALLAFGCLVYAFIFNDFSVIYVAANSNSQLPVYFRMAAVWGRMKALCCCGLCFCLFGLAQWRRLADKCRWRQLPVCCLYLA